MIRQVQLLIHSLFVFGVEILTINKEGKKGKSTPDQPRAQKIMKMMKKIEKHIFSHFVLGSSRNVSVMFLPLNKVSTAL